MRWPWWIWGKKKTITFYHRKCFCWSGQSKYVLIQWLSNIFCQSPFRFVGYLQRKELAGKQLKISFSVVSIRAPNFYFMFVKFQRAAADGPKRHIWFQKSYVTDPWFNQCFFFSMDVYFENIKCDFIQKICWRWWCDATKNSATPFAGHKTQN